MAYIYLGEKFRDYKSNSGSHIDAEINLTTQAYDECRIFDVVKYKIKYPSLQNGSSISTISDSCNLYIYTGRFHGPNGEHKFSYCPGKQGDIVEQVDSYHILNDDLPFALVFNTRDDKIWYCTFDLLKPSLNPKVLPGTPIEYCRLREKLLIDYRGSSKNKTLVFKTGSGEDKNLVRKQQNIGKDNMYKRVIFTPEPGAEDVIVSLYGNNLFTLNPSTGLRNEIDQSCLDKVDNETFNAVIVHYTDLSNGPENLAVLIEFLSYHDRTDIRRTHKYSPSWVEDHSSDNELIFQLNMIRDEIESVITYNLEMDTDSGRSSESVIFRRDTQNSDCGYEIYRHTSAYAPIGQMSILFYNFRQVTPVVNTRIDEIDMPKLSEGDFYYEISTYVLSASPSEHLLIRLDKQFIKCYLYRFNKDGSKWKYLSLEELKEAGIEVSASGGGNLNKELDKLLDEKSRSANVRLLLDYISRIVNSIFILLDQKSPYSESTISPIITDEISIDKDDNSVGVIDDTENSGTCIRSNGYRVYRHDLSSAVKSAKQKLNTDCLYLTFYLDTHKIDLNDNEVQTSTPNYLTYSNYHNDLYVYFYGEDPRPLLFCYSDHAYIPNSKAEYQTKWVKERKIKNCVCLNNDNHKDLLNVLSEVVGFLNEVQLEKKANDLADFDIPVNEDAESIGRYSSPYSLPCLGLNTIYIKVSYKNAICYRVYTHEPKGTGDNGFGFRLGNITHSSNNDIGINYEKSKQLTRVSSYYNVYDELHENLLLVVLEFKTHGGTSDKEYYKLSGKNTKVWQKLIERNDKNILDKLGDPDKIEDALYDLRKKLEIDFDRKDIKPLFNPDKCKEDKINWVAIGAGTGGGVVAVGTVVTAGVLVSNKLAAGAAAAAATTIAL